MANTFTPGERSFLHFATVCLRLMEEEDAAFPSWIAPAEFAGVDVDPSVLARHADRYSEWGARSKKAAIRELDKIPGIPAAEAVRGPLVACLGEHIEHTLLLSAQATDIRIWKQAGELALRRRRQPEAIEQITHRERIVLVFTGLYVGRAAGNKTHAAVFAREGTPRKDQEFEAQHWHVRDALKAYTQPAVSFPLFGRHELSDPLGGRNDLLVRALALNAFFKVQHAETAWKRLLSEPGHHETRHVDRLNRAVASGALIEWLHEAGEGRGDPTTEAGAVSLLRKYVIRQRICAIERFAKARGIDVSALKTTSPNASAPASS